MLALLGPAQVNLPVLQTDISQRVINIINRIRAKHALSLSLYLIRQGGGAEGKMLQFMVNCP